MSKKQPGRHARRRRRIVALVLLAIVAFHAVVAFRLFLSPEQFRLQTLAILGRYWPGKVGLGTAAYEFPARFRLRKLALHRPAERGGGLLFQAKGLRVRCQILAALRGDVRADEVVLDEPHFYLTESDRRRGKAKGRGDTPRPAISLVLLRNGVLDLGPGALWSARAAADARAALPASPAMKLSGLNVELTKERRLANAYAFKGDAKSELWGRCDLHGTVDLEARRLDAEVVVHNVPIGPRLRELLPPKALRGLDRYNFQGAVNLTLKPSVSWATGKPQVELAAVVGLLDCTAAWDRMPLPCRNIRGQVVYDGKDVTYQDIRGRCGTGTFKLSGALTRESAVGGFEKIHTDFVARGLTLGGQLHRAIEAMPPPRRLGPGQKHPLARVWERLGVQGGQLDIEAHSVWVGKERALDATVTGRIRDGRATHTQFPYPLEKLSGTFTWRGSGRNLPAPDDPAPADPAARVRGSTQIELIRGQRGPATVHIRGTATDDGVVDITLEGFEVPLDQALYDALRPNARRALDLLHPEGAIYVSCRMTGPTRPPAKPQFRYTIRPEGVAFIHERFPHRFEDVRGEIRIDERGRVTLHDLAGRLGRIPVTFLGTVARTPKGEASDIRVVAPDVVLGPAVEQYLNDKQRAVYERLDPGAGGRVAFTYHLATTPTDDPQKPQVAQRVEIRCLRHCSIRHEKFPIRITGLLGTVHVDGKAHATFTGMKGRIGDAVLEAIHGEHDADGLRMTLKAGGLVFNDALRRALPETWGKVWDRLRPGGEADVQYELTPSPDDPQRPVQRVSIEPRNASITYAKFPLPLDKIARGKVTFDHEGNTTISNLRGSVRGRAVEVSGYTQGGADKRRIHLDITATKLPLDDKLRDALPAEWQERWTLCQPDGAADLSAAIEADLKTGAWTKCHLTAALDGCRVCYKDLPIPLADLRGRFEFEDGVVRLTNVAGRSRIADHVQLDGRVAQAGKEGTRLRVAARNLRVGPELLAALPASVRKALREADFRGAVDVDVTVSPVKGAGAKGATFNGTVTLRRCSFKRKYAFERVDGEVRIDKGAVDGKGGLELAGALDLRGLVVRKFVLSAVHGQFAYAAPPKDAGAARPPLLTLSGLEASLYGGRLSVPKAELDLATGTVRRASVLLADSDFRAFCCEGLGHETAASGMLDLKLDYPPASLKDAGLVADGQVRVDHGELGDLPVTTAVFDFLSLKLPERSITKGETKFGIAADKLVVKRLALGREGWLMTGWGTVGFDGKLALKFVTPRRGSLLDLPRLVVGSLVEVDVTGTLTKPVTGQTVLPVIPRAFEEFKRILKVW